MSDFMQLFFGPLPREYCVYFYALSIIYGLSFAFGLLTFLAVICANFKKVNYHLVLNGAMGLVNMFLVYLAARLLHTMCVKAI